MSYNIGDKYLWTSQVDGKEYEVIVIDHDFVDHVWFRYTHILDKYPLVNTSRNMHNEFLLPPAILALAGFKKIEDDNKRGTESEES